MDYTLVIVYSNGDTSTEYCATSTDLSNYMISAVRSQFASDIKAPNVTFTVVNNFSL